MTAQELSGPPWVVTTFLSWDPASPRVRVRHLGGKRGSARAVEAGTGREGGDHGLRDSQRGPRGVGPTGLWTSAGAWTGILHLQCTNATCWGPGPTTGCPREVTPPPPTTVRPLPCPHCQSPGSPLCSSPGGLGWWGRERQKNKDFAVRLGVGRRPLEGRGVMASWAPPGVCSRGLRRNKAQGGAHACHPLLQNRNAGLPDFPWAAVPSRWPPPRPPQPDHRS